VPKLIGVVCIIDHNWKKVKLQISHEYKLNRSVLSTVVPCAIKQSCLITVFALTNLPEARDK